MSEQVSKYHIRAEVRSKVTKHVRAHASLVREHMSEVHARRYVRTHVRLQRTNFRTHGNKDIRTQSRTFSSLYDR